MALTFGPPSAASHPSGPGVVASPSHTPHGDGVGVGAVAVVVAVAAAVPVGSSLLVAAAFVSFCAAVEELHLPHLALPDLVV